MKQFYACLGASSYNCFREGENIDHLLVVTTLSTQLAARKGKGSWGKHSSPFLLRDIKRPKSRFCETKPSVLVRNAVLEAWAEWNTPIIHHMKSQEPQAALEDTHRLVLRFTGKWSTLN